MINNLFNKKKFKHLMLDIETMGTKPTSSITSIGAVEFDIETGETGKEFYENIDLKSCESLGLVIEAKTVIWWLKQNKKAKENLLIKNITIIEALKKFSKFCNKDYNIWANSPSFDCTILKGSYEKAGMKIPWDFRKERDVRTIVSLNPDIKKNSKFKGTLHNPIDDCKFQIKYLSKTWNSIKKN